ncbi:uncharacterized protein CEXT_223311 [Caerostris extrusa]|uniref:Uncharacterized protein n=1 Tax=Caerostris extrusa TaxID=172846 RepID=A0AAV4YAJ2_CAEEX|nr:uncharacterized protein CEXT_223311 [Caerostris extrusa]
MKLVILHLSLLVACAFGEYTKGLSGKFPKLERHQASSHKKAEARSLDSIPEPKSEEVLGYGLGDVKTSYGSDGSMEKTLPLPGGHEISVGVGKMEDSVTGTPPMSMATSVDSVIWLAYISPKDLA